jgi:hypothetical protein
MKRHAATALALCGALAGVLMPTVAESADGYGATQTRAKGKGGGSWTRTLDVGLSAADLDLPTGAPARELARAALERKAGRLGLPRALRGLRLDREQPIPGDQDGASELEILRYHQTVRGARVVWSQIDVTIAAGDVSSISATVVPVSGKRLVGKRKVTRKGALDIARRAVKDPEDTLRPLRVAYAGNPTTGKRHWRTPRLAWVVEATPASALDEEAVTPLCIVVDAQTGKVIGRWSGVADRPDRGPDARGAEAGEPHGRVARGVAATPVLDVYDGMQGAQGAPIYARFTVTGDPRDARWPEYFEGRLPGVTRTDVMEAMSANARNVARTICDLRGYCGRQGGFGVGPLLPWQVVGNVPDVPGSGSGSGSNPSRLIVSISQQDVMGLDDPNRPANDIVAHEFGHVMDWVYAGDRVIPETGSVGQVASVQEALADMFAYEYDRFDPTLGEETAAGVIRNWADPGAKQEFGNAFPAHMDDYDTSPSSPHFNSTILSHGYYRLVQRVGHQKAGRLLHNVPQILSPQPTFQQVAQGFTTYGAFIYPQDGSDAGTSSDVGEAAQVAFSQVGLQTTLPRDHRGE